MMAKIKDNEYVTAYIKALKKTKFNFGS